MFPLLRMLTVLPIILWLALAVRHPVTVDGIVGPLFRLIVRVASCDSVETRQARLLTCVTVLLMFLKWLTGTRNRPWTCVQVFAAEV